MFKQPVAGLAGQGEGRVLVVGDARVPHHPAMLKEVGLLGHAAGGVDRRPGTPNTHTHLHYEDILMHTCIMYCFSRVSSSIATMVAMLLETEDLIIKNKYNK